MLILTTRTDKPESEIGLFEANEQLAYETWAAHRQLAETIHIKIEEILKSAGKSWQDIEGIVCYSGPGSFTGLRIGLTVGNALSSSLGVPIVGHGGNDWVQTGLKNLANGKNEKVVTPEYGGEVFVTKPHK